MPAVLASDTMVIRDVDTALREFSTAPLLAVDVETTGLSHFRDKVAVISIAAPARPPAVLHFPGAIDNRVLRFLESKDLVGHNMVAFDLPFLMGAGFIPSASRKYYDTLILEQLCLVSGRRDLSRSLAATVDRRLGLTLDKNVDHAGWSNVELTSHQILYCANDVQLLHRLLDVQLTKLSGLNLDAALTTELDAAVATSWLIRNGLPISRTAMKQAYEDFQDESRKKREELAAILGPGVKPRSPKSIITALESVFGVHVDSTNDESLQLLEASGGKLGVAAAAIRKIRQLEKLSMYDERWSEKYLDSDDRARARYWQLGTDTGRYSSSDPNLQQWPKRLRYVVGYEHDDRSIVSLDYSQIEVLIAALAFKEQSLADQVLHGDAHTDVANRVFLTTTPTKEQRQAAKAASFTLLFAGGVPGLQRSARDLDVTLSVEQCRRIIASYYSQFPRIAGGISRIRSTVQYRQQQGMAYAVTVPLGPRRSLFGASLSPSSVINTLVQGTAAVGLKRSFARLAKTRWISNVAAVVHDEIVFDCPASDVPALIEDAVECMKSGMEEVLHVRPNVSVKYGRTW